MNVKEVLVAGKRRYSTALRAEQTAAARLRILDESAHLFGEHGYLGTTLTHIAAAAGVSVQTVYNVVGGKAVLLKAVYDRTLAGDDEPVPISARPEAQAMQRATDGRTCLAGYARLSRVLGARVLPLVAMLLAQAATGDPDLREFADTTENERRTGNRATAGLVAERFGLRADLDVETATDVLWALTAPDVTDRLVRRCGWGWDRYERWLADTMADALLTR